MNSSIHDLPPNEIKNNVYPNGLENRDALNAIFRFAYLKKYQDVEK